MQKLGQSDKACYVSLIGMYLFRKAWLSTYFLSQWHPAWHILNPLFTLATAFLRCGSAVFQSASQNSRLLVERAHNHEITTDQSRLQRYRTGSFNHIMAPCIRPQSQAEHNVSVCDAPLASWSFLLSASRCSLDRLLFTPRAPITSLRASAALVWGLSLAGRR